MIAYDPHSEVPVKRAVPAGGPVAPEDLGRLVESVGWYHGFELLPGLVTPGRFRVDPKGACDAFGIPADLTGMKALDIGAWDGAYTFELERRGAYTLALDIQDPSRVGFDVARRILNSRAIHYQGSVYQLPYDEMANLDLVLFAGVLYHLKHPLLALEHINAAMKLGARLYFETEALLYYVEDGEHRSVSSPKIWREVNATGAPLCASYVGRYKGSTNWFVPNRVCLAGWLRACGFEVHHLVENIDREAHQRIYGWAIKVSEESEIEHGVILRFGVVPTTVR